MQGNLISGCVFTNLRGSGEPRRLIVFVGGFLVFSILALSCKTVLHA